MVRYHGNYCGPNWSDGKVQQSVVGTTVPIDEFDETCKIHDSAYARGGNLKQADIDFYNANVGKGVKRSVAALAVGMQSLLRSSDGKMKKNLRGKPSGVSQVPKSVQMVRQKQSAAPAALSRRTQTLRPIIKNNSSGSVVISHREFITNVNNATSTSINVVAVNPGVAQTFSWLSRMALNFDRYKFFKLKFNYVSSCSTATSGRTGLAFDFNAVEEIPSQKAAYYSIVPNVEDNVWKSMDLVIPCDRKEYYTRTGSKSTIDRKTYDMGVLFRLNDLGGDTATVGELYVEYTVELLYPRPQVDTGAMLRGVGTTSNFFLNNTTTTYGNQYMIGDNIENVTTANIYQNGTYLLNFVQDGTTLAGTGLLSILNGLGTYTQTTNFGIVNTAATKYIHLFIAVITIDPVAGYAALAIQGATGATYVSASLTVALIGPSTGYIFP